MKERELIVIDQIGTFQLNKEQKIQFEADSKANYLDESFGLTEVYFKPIIREEEISDTMKRVHPSQARQAVRRAPVQKRTKPVSSTEEELVKKDNVAEEPVNNQVDSSNNESVQPKTVKASNKSVVFIALPILLLLFAAGSALFLMQNQGDNSSIQEASMTGSIGDSGDVVTVSEETLPEEKDVENEVEEIMSPEVVVEEVEPVVASAISSDDNRYFIIGGSFGELARAEKMANNVTGAKIIEGNGLYRVAVASFSSKNKAFSSLNDYKGEFGSDIWVLIK